MHNASKCKSEVSVVFVNFKRYLGPLIDRPKVLLRSKTPHDLIFSENIAVWSTALLVLHLWTDLLLTSCSTQYFT